MTIQEAINWIKEKHCPDDWDVDCDDANAMRMAIEALKRNSPCDLCRFNPPSSTDGKPCGMCPAVAIEKAVKE